MQYVAIAAHNILMCNAQISVIRVSDPLASRFEWRISQFRVSGIQAGAAAIEGAPPRPAGPIRRCNEE
jgi:hypothetical protein